MRNRRSPAIGWPGIAALLVALSGSAPAAAQSADTRALFNRIDRLQNELTTLQRYVYRGEKPPAAAAPPPAAAAPAPNIAARLQVRITQLEGEIQRLTGRNEEIAHRLDQIEERLKKLSTDLEFRLGRLERGEPALAAATPAAAAPKPDAPAAPPSRAPAMRPVPQKVPGAEMGAKPLGMVRPSAPLSAEESTAKLTPEQQYNRAHTLIIRDRNYAEAERVLRSFIDNNPKHKLLPNAHYWLGRTYFVRDDFEQAAFAFAEGFQRFPKSEKAPANLLNLGMSLARLGKTREACTTYSRLLKNFPNAEDSVKRRVARETARANCH